MRRCGGVCECVFGCVRMLEGVCRCVRVSVCDVVYYACVGV